MNERERILRALAELAPGDKITARVVYADIFGRTADDVRFRASLDHVGEWTWRKVNGWYSITVTKREEQ